MSVSRICYTVVSECLAATLTYLLSLVIIAIHMRMIAPFLVTITLSYVRQQQTNSMSTHAVKYIKQWTLNRTMTWFQLSQSARYAYFNPLFLALQCTPHTSALLRRGTIIDILQQVYNLRSAYCLHASIKTRVLQLL